MMENRPLSSVELKSLSTLKTELQILQNKMKLGTYDDLEHYLPVEAYMSDRISELERRLKK